MIVGIMVKNYISWYLKPPFWGLGEPDWLSFRSGKISLRELVSEVIFENEGVSICRDGLILL
ncbi:hypothetical protein, partial [Leptospira sp. id769339]|uniref:hypothetical protein n=1 Tax=Leptospira sp. id769339 TaxID=2864221 RepID=UPI00214BA554